MGICRNYARKRWSPNCVVVYSIVVFVVVLKVSLNLIVVSVFMFGCYGFCSVVSYVLIVILLSLVDTVKFRCVVVACSFCCGFVTNVRSVKYTKQNN